ncbi:hypothetical protein C8J57DRAFT_1509357 [Mycena rebaudengoi]|nr:hypothetical protein C8J57DRAFT_1509357 [Mycena rebaudengoi]
MVPVNFEPDAPAILCRRSCLICKGCFVCERIDPSLLAVDRFDLDSVSRDAVLAAQKETCRNEGTTTENNAAVFMDVVRSQRCEAKDRDGKKCAGEPVLRALKKAASERLFLKSIKRRLRKFSLAGEFAPSLQVEQTKR